MDYLPLFPLGMVAFPPEQVNLHIFEPRYKQLIEESEQTGMRFGIACHIKGEPIRYGTEMALIEVHKRYDDGKMDIATRAIRPFIIEEFHAESAGKLYPGGHVRYMEYEEVVIDSHLRIEVISQLATLYKLINLDIVDHRAKVHQGIYNLAHKVGMNIKQEIEFLQLTDENSRLQFVNEHLQKVIPIIKEMEATKVKVKMNGHYKQFDPTDFR